MWLDSYDKQPDRESKYDAWLRVSLALYSVRRVDILQYQAHPYPDDIFIIFQ